MCVVSIILTNGAELTRVASSDKNPRSLGWGNLIAPWHWEVDIVSEILQVIDSLLDRVVLQTLDSEIRIGIAESIEPVFKYDCGSILLLC